jgi:hypothetical protein
MDSRGYIGQFSDDGRFFIAAFQVGGWGEAWWGPLGLGAGVRQTRGCQEGGREQCLQP